MRKYNRSATLTILTSGVIAATAASTIRDPRVMYLAKSSALKISTTTATGSLRPSTAMYGIRGLLPDGLLITKAIGPGWILGGGHGWMMHPGVMLPLTTDAGPLLEAVGDGYQAQWK